MALEESQIYQGGISISGEAGPVRKWIIVSPFGKTHAHSIDDPLDLHCLPLGIAIKGIREGRLQLLNKDPSHPVMQLQREKEARGIRDIHLGLHGETTEGMMELLAQATRSGKPYAPYAAGEILALLNTAFYSYGEMRRIVRRVRELVHVMPSMNTAATH